MATLGKPSISNSRDPRGMTEAISNIRQRIEAIEGLLGTVNATVGQASTAGSTQFNTLRQLIAQLTALVDQLAAEIVAADDAQLQIAVRSFQPHNPSTPGTNAEETTNQIAVRAFMPHMPLTQALLPESSTDQLATRAFAPHVPLVAPVAFNDTSGILANQIFGA